MKSILWSFILVPLGHFLFVGGLLWGLGWSIERWQQVLRAAKQSKDQLSALPINIKTASIYAQVTRANGKVEANNLVAYTHRNPLRRWSWAIKTHLFRRN